tara:strand:+ start:44336 stop:45190 length:855 start_codon:yes stop_codon:yes gene_type:complete
MTALNSRSEAIIARYCAHLPKEFETLITLLEGANVELQRSSGAVHQLNQELHRMSGAALCMGFPFLGSELEKAFRLVQDLRLNGVSDPERVLKSIASKIYALARLKEQVTPDNSLLMRKVINPVTAMQAPSRRRLEYLQEILAEERIIFADDDVSIRMLMREILVSLGVLNVATVSSGEEFLDMCSAFKPTLVITDWHMKPINGLELLERIRFGRSNLSPDTKVIFLTSKGTLAHVQQPVAAGCDHFLVKPFSRRLVERALLNVTEYSAAAGADAEEHEIKRTA